MGRSYGKVFAVVGLCLAFSLFGADAAALSPAPATQFNGGGSTEVSVSIQPVRLVLINDQNKIVKIISNSTANVTPTVYKRSFSSPPIAISPDIRQQYDTILAGLDTARTGTIYQAEPSIISRVVRLGGFYMTANMPVVFATSH